MMTGKELKALRNKWKKTQVQLGELLGGYHYKHISALENDIYPITPKLEKTLRDLDTLWGIGGLLGEE